MERARSSPSPALLCTSLSADSGEKGALSYRTTDLLSYGAGCRSWLVTLTQNLAATRQKKGSVAISRSRILGKWDHRGLVAALPRDSALEQVL
jgi:hypothetical protein